MGENSNIPLLLIAVGAVVILAIVVLLVKMKKQSSASSRESFPRGESKRNRRPERKTPPPRETPGVQKRESILAGEEKRRGETTAPRGPQTIQGPIPEAPGIDRDSFTKFAGKRVLVVEDNKINQKLILTLLSASRIDLQTAENGHEALEKLRAPGAKYDLVLMDVNMPGMDGLQATREIRKDPAFRHLPVIALTASTTSQEVAAILESGMNGYLDKPIVLGKLYKAFELFMQK